MHKTLSSFKRRLASVLAVACLATAPISVAAPGVAAQGLVHEMRVGVLYHDVPDLWSQLSLETTAPDINVEAVLTPGLPLLWGVIRPAVGASINTGGGTSHAYADARWQVDLSSGFFLGLGLGAAVHDGELGPVALDKKALGGRVLFHIPFEIGYRFDARNSISLYFEHISNGDTKRYNEGLDRLGLRYGIGF